MCTHLSHTTFFVHYYMTFQLLEITFWESKIRLCNVNPASEGINLVNSPPRLNDMIYILTSATYHQPQTGMAHASLNISHATHSLAGI